MDDVHQSPYGDLRAQGLAELQSSFDTRELLWAVEDLNRFCAQWKRELRVTCSRSTTWRTRSSTAPRRALLRAKKACPERRIRLARNSENGGNRSQQR